MNKTKTTKSLLVKVLAITVILFYSLFIMALLENHKIRLENENLKQQMKELTYEEPELEPCFMCGEEVEIQQYNNRYKIKCDLSSDDNKGCLLETGSYESKIELVERWNSIPRGE